MADPFPGGAQLIAGDPFPPGGGPVLITDPLQGPELVTSGIGWNKHAGGGLVTSVPFEEIDGYKERFREDESQAVRYFQVPWLSRHAFRVYMLGYPSVKVDKDPDTGILTARLSRVPPDQHPEMYWLYATEVELVRGVGGIYQANIPALDADGTPAFEGPATLDPVTGFPVDPTPGTNPMIAYAEVSPQGFDRAGGLAVYAVTYRALDYEVRNDGDNEALGIGELARYVSRRFLPGLQGIDLPSTISSQLQFNDPTAPPDVQGKLIPKGSNMLILLPKMTLEYTWHQVPDIPWEAIQKCMGRVNEGIFDAAAAVLSERVGHFIDGFQDETLLCQAPQITRHRSPLGRVSWDIVYRFDWQPRGWNAFPSPNGTFYKVTVGNGPNAAGVFAPEDFTSLFEIPLPHTYQ